MEIRKHLLKITTKNNQLTFFWTWCTIYTSGPFMGMLLCCQCSIHNTEIECYCVVSAPFTIQRLNVVVLPVLHSQYRDWMLLCCQCSIHNTIQYNIKTYKVFTIQRLNVVVLPVLHSQYRDCVSCLWIQQNTTKLLRNLCEHLRRLINYILHIRFFNAEFVLWISR